MPSEESIVVTQVFTSFGLADRTSLRVHNQHAGDLTSAVIEVVGEQTEFDGIQSNGTWRTRTLPLPEGVDVTIATESLFDARGANPSYQLRIDTFTIFVDDKPILQGKPHALSRGYSSND